MQSIAGNSSLIADVATKDGLVIASAVFLTDNQTIHYHLGGSNSDYHSLNPNIFLMLAMAEYAGKQKFHQMHIGGGLSMSADDSLYRFKKGFSSNEYKFCIGKKIHNQKLYNIVSSNWRCLTGLEPKILLHYHEGVS